MRIAGGWRRALMEPFAAGARAYWPIVLAYLAINGLVLLNSALHDPRVGYDASAYLAYVEALAEWRMVTPEDSWEYFSPPLPFVVPAALVSLTELDVFGAARWAQMGNVILSLGLTYFLLRLCLLIGSAPALRLGALLFLGVLPVYYRTFVMVRGEPMVALFCVIAVYFAARMFACGGKALPDAVWMGGALGLGAASRQWGVLVIPAVLSFGAIQWLRSVGARRQLAAGLAIGAAVAFFTGAGFYLRLQSVYGTMTQFNREPAPSFSLANQPPEFYSELALDRLFVEPIRPVFLNRLFPVLYADLWGDYWAYFVVYGRDTRTSAYLAGKDLMKAASETPPPDWLETNFRTAGPGLGRANVVGLFPSVLALLALVSAVAGLWRQTDARRRDIGLLLLMVIAVTVVGYLWFVIRYPAPDLGDTLKASYLLHIYPLIAVLVGALLERIDARSRRAGVLIAAGLVLAWLLNLPMMLTGYRLIG